MPYSILPAAEIYGPVQSGEMLWNIAAEVNPDQKFTRYQLMTALWKINPQAFSVSCNMNSLKVGSRLTIPSDQQIEQLTATQARETFNQHYEVWKNRSRQPIECPELNAESVSVTKSVSETANDGLLTERNFNPVIPTLREPITQTQENPLSSPPLASAVDAASQSLNAEDEQQTISPPLKTEIKQTVPSEKPHLKPQWVPPELGDEPLSVVKTFFKQLLAEHFFIAIILMSLLGIGGLVLVMGLFWVLRWLFRRRTSSHTPPPEEHQQTIFSKRYQDSPPPPTQTNFNNADNNLKDKLAAARAGLVQEEELIQVLLREVLEKGTADQQAEAKQLIEINKKMHHLAANSSSTTTNPLQAVVQQGQQITQPIYLPDNKKQIFAMIDKIFVLLDDELKAGGQLVRAYQQRHQQEFNQTSYQDDSQTEKILVEKSGDNWTDTDEKSTRHL